MRSWLRSPQRWSSQLSCASRGLRCKRCSLTTLTCSGSMLGMVRTMCLTHLLCLSWGRAKSRSGNPCLTCGPKTPTSYLTGTRLILIGCKIPHLKGTPTSNTKIFLIHGRSSISVSADTHNTSARSLSHYIDIVGSICWQQTDALVQTGHLFAPWFHMQNWLITKMLMSCTTTSILWPVWLSLSAEKIVKFRIEKHASINSLSKNCFLKICTVSWPKWSRSCEPRCVVKRLKRWHQKT